MIGGELPLLVEAKKLGKNGVRMIFYLPVVCAGQGR